MQGRFNKKQEKSVRRNEAIGKEKDEEREVKKDEKECKERKKGLTDIYLNCFELIKALVYDMLKIDYNSEG